MRETEPIEHLSPQSTSEYILTNSHDNMSPPRFKYEQWMDLATCQYHMQEVDDTRILEHEEFISDQDFIHTAEFNIFLCQYKGKIIRQKPSERDEEENLQMIQEDIDKEMKEMTLERER